MAVTVGHLGAWRRVHGGETVSSAPSVARLREREQSNQSLVVADPMDSRRGGHGSPKDDAGVSATWINASYEDRVKKDKKWSIGKLFRRKKKDSGSDSASSDEHSQKRNGGKNKKKKSKNLDDRSDHHHRSQSVTKTTTTNNKEYYDEGVLSDPSAGFIGYVGRGLPRSPKSSCGGSQDGGSLRKGRKGRLKARVEAMRNMKHESSSDEESQRSTSSSIVRFKSDDSLANISKGGDSTSKRSRSARTDRYMKRLSRDEEVPNEKESENIQRMIMSKKDVDSFSNRQRILHTPQINGSINSSRDEVEYCEPHRIYQNAQRSMSSGLLAAGPGSLSSKSNLKSSYVAGSNSSVYSYPAGIISLNAKVNDENISYSIPYNNLSKQANSNRNSNLSRSMSNNNNSFGAPNYENTDVMVVKFPLGNVNTTKKDVVVPPVPPPRDPQRKVPTPLSYMYDNIRPVSYNFDNSQRSAKHKAGENRSNISTPNNFNSQNIYANSAHHPKVENNLTWNKRPISTSEDHIAMQQTYQNMTPQYYQNNQPKRPSSVTAEIIRPDVYNRYLNRPIVNQDMGQNYMKSPAEAQNQEYLYFADKTPRSRKPIHITPGGASSDVQNNAIQNQPRNASEFWRKMDSQEVQRRRQPGGTRHLSDVGVNGIVTNANAIRKSMIANQNNIQKPNIVNNDAIRSSRNKTMPVTTPSLTNGHNFGKNIKNDEPICYSNIDIIPMDDIRKDKKNKLGQNSDDESKSKKKPNNLDDALSELEAIYNSLGLGDEDLLDRAEKRELMSPKSTESFPFNLSQNEYLRHPDYSGVTEYFGNRNPMSRRSTTPDKLHDDMAFRRLNPHERPKSKDVNSLVSQISYMLTSPVLMETVDGIPKPASESRKSEPDIVLDDVAFRNIRQANNYLKIIDPQPPFGIPLGPVSPAPYSSYLQAPDSREKPREMDQDTPDVVMDDLAYRALRKDCRSVTFGNEDERNDLNKYNKITEPSAIFDNHVIKKKRAVRSLSANIFTMIQKEIDDALDLYNKRPLEKTKSIPDLPDSVIQFGKSGKLPSDFQVSSALPHDTNNIAHKSCSSKVNGISMATKSSYPNYEKSNNVPSYKLNYDKCKAPINDNSNFGEKGEIHQKPTELTKSSKYPLEFTIENKFKSNMKSPNENGFSVNHSTKVFSDKPQNISISHKTNIYKEKSPDPPRRNLSPNKILSLEKPSTDSTMGESTEDSLLQISNHLNKLGDRLKPSVENQNDFEEEGKKLKALALKCNIDLDEKKSSTIINGNDKLSSQQEQRLPLPNVNSNAPEKMNQDQLEKMPSFEDLRKGINELLNGISQVTDRFNLQKSLEKPENKPNEEKLEERKESPLPDEESDKSKDNRSSPEYNSSEELAMIFNLNKEESGVNPGSIPETSAEVKTCDKHSDLNSPRLVKNADQNFARHSVEAATKGGECSKSLIAADDCNNSNNSVPWRRPRGQSSSRDNETKGDCDDVSDPAKSSDWIRDTDYLLLACLFTMAYTQQLAGFDVVSLLGIVLAVVCVIAMLIM